MSEAHQRALLIEQNLRSSQGSWQGSTGSKQKTTPPVETAVTTGQDTQPRDNQARLNARAPTFKCFNCGGIGHRQSSCPKCVFLANDEVVYDDDGELEHDREELEEQVNGDIGQLLVIRRNMLTPQVIDESRSSCTIRGKVCRFVIDFGSCTNVISEEAVAKLALFAEPHPTPYKLVWLNKQTDIRTSRRCKVPFSVGQNYRDVICCDVVPMDACHLLLG